MIQYGVSIVVCTYNGAERLRETIRHIALQQVPAHIRWEFIIVANACTDNTIEAARAFWKEYGGNPPFLIVEEPKPGLSFARSTGFSAANYEYVLMCDDDNWLSPQYVRLVYEIMTGNTNIGALGGNGSLVYQTEPPQWVKEFIIFAAGPQAPRSGPAKNFKLYGAGCVIRKSAYELLLHAGFRSLLTDRLGQELSSGGDYELCYALVMAGYEMWYDERLTFKHFIPSERFTRDYYLKYIRESSKCFEVLEPYKIICERRFINFKSFRIMMYKMLFHYIQRYASMRVRKFFSMKGGTRDTILSLRLYSIHMKISLLVANRRAVLENYKRGRAFEQSFSRNYRSLLSRAVQSMFPLSDQPVKRHSS